MERRWCERIPVNAEAYVCYHGHYIPVELRNVSLEGAWVALGAQSRDEQPGEGPVELVLERGGELKIPAEVTHREPSGLGLAFHYEGHNDFRKIRDLWMQESYRAAD